MNILKMLGLVQAEDYAKLERERAIEMAALESLRREIESLGQANGEAFRALQSDRDDWRAKHVSVASKNEQQAREIDTLRRDVSVASDLAVKLQKACNVAGSRLNDALDEIALLRPDAEAMRAKRKRDVEQKAEKRRAAKSEPVRNGAK